MQKGNFTHFEWVSYLTSGVILVVSIELTFGHLDAFAKDTGRQMPEIWNVTGVLPVFILAVCYLLGHLNSFLAHWVLQEGVTATTLGRPSRWLLFGTRTSRIAFFKSLEGHTLDEIDCRLRTECSNIEFKQACDREIFSFAHRTVQADPAFSERHDQLLDAFNFCRNVTMALILAFLLAVTATLKVPAFSWSFEFFVDLARQVLVALLQPHLLAMLFILWLASLRYLYCLRAYSKAVFMEFARPGMHRLPPEAPVAQFEPMRPGLPATVPTRGRPPEIMPSRLP